MFGLLPLCLLIQTPVGNMPESPVPTALPPAAQKAEGRPPLNPDEKFTRFAFGVGTVPIGSARKASDIPFPQTAVMQEERPVELDQAPTRLLSAKRAQKAVHELVALGPRMGGTPSGDASAEYLRAAFEKAGLRVIAHAEPPSLVQWQESWSLIAHIQEGETQRRHAMQRSWPYGYSPSQSGRFPVGLEPNEGQVTLFSKFHTPHRNGPVLAASLVDGMNTSLGDWPRLRFLRRSLRNPYPSFGISSADGSVLREALKAGHAVELQVELVAHVEKRPSASIEAILHARKDAPKGYFLICAHGDSDSGGPGANDNASGVAIVLEMARAWKEAIDKGWVPSPAREVRFVIWSSEIRSTRHYLDRVQEQKLPLLGVLNFDQAGYGVGAEQLNIEPDDLVANHGFIQNAVQELEKGAGRNGLPKLWATNKSLGGTDSYVFSSAKEFRERGLPAVTMFTSAWDKPEEHPRTDGQLGESWSDRDKVTVDYDPYYHSAGDLPKNTTDKETHNIVWCAATGWLSVQSYLETLPALAPPPLEAPGSKLLNPEGGSGKDH